MGGYRHDSQRTIHCACTAKKNLEQQVSVLEASKKTQDAEISRLREQLGAVSPASTRKELEAFIQRLDKEIVQKRDEFARGSMNLSH
jgi:predicted  nucleic acid-binding Zn-ribbon protein